MSPPYFCLYVYKSKVEISQNFVAFSEHTNFNEENGHNVKQTKMHPTMRYWVYPIMGFHVPEVSNLQTSLRR